MVSAPPSRWTLPVVLVAQFVTPLSIAGTAIALPAISADLGSQPAALQWVVNGFNVAFALSTLIWGPIGDRIGHRATFTVGAAAFAAGSAVSASAPSLVILDGARVLAGVGAAAILTGASSLLSNAFDGAARAKGFALFGTVNGLGLALGPTVSGVLVAAIGWRGGFAVQAVLLALAVLGSRALPRTVVAPGIRDAVRTASRGSLLRNREFVAMCLVPMAGSAGFVTLLTYLPSAFGGIKGLSAGAAGPLMLVMTVPVLVAPTIVAALVGSVSRVTVGSVVHVSLVALVLGSGGMLLLAPDRSIAWVILPMILLGFGFGLPIGLVDGHALAVVPPEQTGRAAGVLNFCRIGSEAAFVAAYAFVLSSVVDHRLMGTAAAETAAGMPGHADVYADAFAVTVGGVVAVLVVLSFAVFVVRSGERVWGRVMSGSRW
ncbi:MFS transporter [Rhodococcus rhodnii]|uniref:MFS transporter n=1 Tax=Rhodococcus rhodnii TaxID=38312 RepID=UPI001EE7188F|nr:MFS transporter [Rhodococcus rhodnii]